MEHQPKIEKVALYARVSTKDGPPGHRKPADRAPGVLPKAGLEDRRRVRGP